jgi:hypothetical protein
LFEFVWNSFVSIFRVIFEFAKVIQEIFNHDFNLLVLYVIIFLFSSFARNLVLVLALALGFIILATSIFSASTFCHKFIFEIFER